MVWLWFFFAFTVGDSGENGGDDENNNDESGFWDTVISGINSVVEGITNVTGSILNGLKELLLSLFVPEQEYFQNKFDNIKIKFLDRVGIDTSEFEQLKDISSEDVVDNDNFKVNLFGKDMKIIDLSFLNGILPQFHNLIRGFLYPLLIFYNMDQIYFLIRGTHLYKRGGDEE